MPSYTASDPTARRNYFPTSLRLHWCVRGLQAKLMGWCRNLQDIALIVHNSVSSLFECFSPRKTAHNCSSKKQIIVSFISKLIFIVSVTQTHQPDLFPGDLSFREFCSVKFGSSHCSRSGRLNISIWLIDLYGRAQNIERIALRRNAWNEDGRPGGIYLRRPALVCVPSERAMRLKNNHYHNVSGVRENCVCGIILMPHTKPITSLFFILGSCGAALHEQSSYKPLRCPENSLP